jgi:hypothetical protein
MMAMKEHAVALKLAFCTAVGVLALLVTGCAAGSAQQVSLASHGMDYIPAFDTPYSGGNG